MPIRIRELSVLLAISLTGCAGMDYAMKNYTGVPITRFKYDNDTYRIFDKPAENRLMITSSLGAAAGAGAVKGFTLGLSGPMTVESDFRRATKAYLDSTDRRCTILEGSLVVQPQWEFTYRCD